MKNKLKLSCLVLVIFLALTALVSCALPGGGEEGETVHEHTYDENWTEVKKATCKNEGVASRACTECGEVTEKAIPKTAHTPSDNYTVVTVPDAENDGKKTSPCTVCAEVVETVIPKHEHQFSGDWTVITAATSKKVGKISNVCDVCDITITKAVTYCEEHTFTGQWQVIVAPTLTANGRSSNTCDTCGATVSVVTDKLTITELQLKSAPYNTVYFTGDLFNPYGLVITAVLSDGSTQEIKRGWEIITNQALTSSNAVAIVKYEGLTLEIPITVSSAIVCSVSNALDKASGDLLYVKGYCVGSCTAEDGSIQYLIKDMSQNAFIILSDADYEYKANDKLEFYATVASDSYGKYLVYSDENESGEKTVVSSDNRVSFTQSSGNTLISSTETEAFFATDIQRYDCPVFSNRFYIVKDGNDYLIHFNASAADKESAALVSGKVIRISAENIDEGSAITNLPADMLTTYPGILVSGSVTALYIGSDAANYYLQLLDTSWMLTTPYTPGEEYIQELAYAFYYQLPDVDYDQYNTRRNINPTPEDATAQQRIYLDCSSYVNAIYYNAFGENILPYTIKEKSANTNNFMKYARENTDAIDVIGYWECRDYKTDDEQKALLSELLKELRVGDVIVYRKGNAQTLEEGSGHALIYVGEGKILHCMNTESYEHNGTNPDKAYDYVSSTSIGFESTYNLFENPTATRYLFNSSYVNFTILRPLNRSLTPTDQTEARMTIPSLTMEKRVDKNMYTAVFANDLLTYTIGLENNGTHTLTGVSLTEYVPEGTEFVEGNEGVTHENGVISWTGNIVPGETVIITFTVKVTESSGRYIESNRGSVNGVYLNKITNTYSKMNAQKLDELSATGKEIVENNTAFTDPIEIVNLIYSELLDKKILDYESITAALNDIIDVDNRSCNPNAAVSDIVIENLSGGYLIKGINPHNNDRIRAIRIEYLSVGDVIIAEHSTNSAGTEKRQVAFVYLGNNEFLKVDSATGSCTVEIFEAPTGKKIQNLLASLYSYEKYAFIRPSLTNEAN